MHVRWIMNRVVHDDELFLLQKEWEEEKPTSTTPSRCQSDPARMPTAEVSSVSRDTKQRWHSDSNEFVLHTFGTKKGINDERTFY